MGRVLLAGLPESQFETFLSGVPLEAYTDHTVTDPDALREITGEVRRQGWALVDQELELGLRSVAVPLLDRADRVFAAINVSTHASRASIADIKNNILPELLKCAQHINRAYGSSR